MPTKTSMPRWARATAGPKFCVYRSPATETDVPQAARGLGANYEARIFAYPEEGQMVVITPWSLRQITHELIVDVFSEVKGEQALDELADQPGLRIDSRLP